VFVFAAAPAFVLAGLMDGSWRPAMQRPLTMLYGSATVMGTFLVYLLVTRSLVPYIEQIRFNTRFAAHYCVDIGRFPDVGLLGSLRLSWKIIRYYPGTSDEERPSFLKAQLRSHMPTLIFVSRSFEDRTIRHVNSLILPFVKEYGYVRLSDRLWYRAQAKG
jgi:hypothetical protein